MTAAANPSAMPRFSGGNETPIAAFATGIMPPAPAACTTRPTSKSPKPPTVCDKPHRQAPAQNVHTQTANTRRRPTVSATLPMTGMSAA